MAGWVYVVEFSDGSMKVGRGSSVAARMAEHARDAKNFGVEIVETWRAFVDDPTTEEWWLIERAKAWGARTRNGREWFNDSVFDALVREGDTRFGVSPSAPSGALYADA